MSQTSYRAALPRNENGGDEGSRTPVRNYVKHTFYTLSLGYRSETPYRTIRGLRPIPSSRAARQCYLALRDTLVVRHRPRYTGGTHGG